MSDNIRIWVEISHSAAYRSGGWAYVRAEGRALTGAAGGDRTSADAAALTAFLASLVGLPANLAVEVLSASPQVAGLGRRIADLAAGGEPPTEDLALWAQAATALKARPVRFGPTPATPRTPAAFAVAWAELARDKAKTRPFQAAIPKANLVKAGVPV